MKDTLSFRFIFGHGMTLPYPTRTTNYGPLGIFRNPLIPIDPINED